MARCSSLRWLVLVGLVGCTGGRDLPPVEHSPGFFADFDRMVDGATGAGAAEERVRQLRWGFATALDQGPAPEESAAAGPVWDKIAIFLEMGIRTADVMAEVPGAEENQVTMYTAAADRVLRCDVAALDAWNARVREMGRHEAQLVPTGPLAWASLELVLALSEGAAVERWVESGEWVEGHWERTEGHYQEVWVPGYIETLWEEGICWDEYVGTDCATYWVDEQCDSYYVDDGYWETYCAEYDEWGYCVYYEEEWVDMGYWETYCEPGYYFDECWDLYETVCEEGHWEDVWVPGYWTQGPWVPGEDVWIEAHWADTSGYRTVVLVEQEAEILAEGVGVLLARAPDAVGADCAAALSDALEASSGAGLRAAIMACIE